VILGDIVIDKIVPKDAYGSLLKGKLSYTERQELITSLLRKGKDVAVLIILIYNS
jgi:hypothetical protein